MKQHGGLGDYDFLNSAFLEGWSLWDLCLAEIGSAESGLALHSGLEVDEEIERGSSAAMVLILVDVTPESADAWTMTRGGSRPLPHASMPTAHVI